MAWKGSGMSLLRFSFTTTDHNPSLQNQQRQMPQMQQSRGQHPLPQPGPTLLAPVSASVPRYCFDNDTYWYIIEAQMSDGRYWELARYYADFYDFQIALLEKFPAEAGQTGKTRTLPYMPGPVAHVTDAISNGRRQNLDEYIKKIVDQPDYIREDILVRQLFAPRAEDYEIDPTIGDDYRLSGQSLAQTQSRGSSGAGSMQLPPHPAFNSMPPPHNSATTNSMRNGAPNNSRPSYGSVNSGGGPGKPSFNQQPPPPLHNQASNLTQNSTGSGNSATPKSSGLAGALRVKLEYDSDVIAMRVAQEEINYDTLVDKIRGRLRITQDVTIEYRDDPSGGVRPFESEEDLQDALKRNGNLRLVIKGRS